jgi:PKD repeat protein
VSGIASATTDNNTGVASPGFDVSIISVKIARDSDGALVAGYQGIQYAMAAGADVINMSWGSYSYSSTAQNIITSAYNDGITLVAAAGNDNTSSTHYPAGYNHVIAVAASDNNDEKASFSNYGSWIDITAPGTSIYNTVLNDNYGYKQGTSMASPVVAGVAGTMLSSNPAMTPDSVESCVKSSADSMPTSTYYQNGDLGAGRVNFYKALQCAGANDSIPPTADFTANKLNIYAGDSVNFTDLSSNQPTSWQWSFQGGTPNSSNVQHPQDIQYNNPGSYDVTLIASNAYGSDTLTKQNYINVDSSLTCDTILTYYNRSTNFVYYFPGDTVGNNYDFNGSAYVTAYWVGMVVDTIIGAKDEYEIRLYDAGGDSLPTGPPLATQKFKADTQGAFFQLVSFDNPAKVTSRFVTVVDASYNDDTMGVFSNDPGAGDGNGERRAAQVYNGNWYKMDDLYVGGFDADLMILPVLSDTLPIAQFAQSADTICEGWSVNYDASASRNTQKFHWSFPGGTPDTSSKESQSVIYNTPGTYDVQLVVENCAKTDTLLKQDAITVIPEPNTNVTPSSATICEGDTVKLVASGASSYNWSPSTGLSKTTGDTVLAFPSDSTTYQVQGSDATGTCTGTDASNIHVIDPEVTVQPDSFSMCIGDSIQLVASGAQTFSWSPSSSLSSSSGDSVWASPSDTTTYEVIGDLNGCKDTNYAWVATFDNSAVAQFSANTTSACPGTTINFDGSSSQNTSTYDWDFPGGTPSTATGSNPSITYNSPGTYDVTLRALSGCGNDTLTKSGYITIDNDPTISVTPTDTTLCEADTATLTASGANTYQWSPSSGLSSTTGSSVLAYPSSSTTYQVIGTNSNGCQDTATAIVNISSPSVSISASSTSICPNETATLSASGANSYKWSPAGSLSDSTGSSVDAAPNSTTTYVVTGTNAQGCQDTASITITVSGSLPTADFLAFDTTGCNRQDVIFDASGSSNSNSYDWTFQAGNPLNSTQLRDTITYTNTGSFDVTLVVTNSCGSDTMTKANLVDIYAKPGISVLPANTTICKSKSVALMASGANSYVWSPAKGLNTTTGDSVVASPSDTTQYMVVGSNSQNCRDSAYVTVNVDECSGIDDVHQLNQVEAYVDQRADAINISFQLKSPRSVRVKLFNQLGQNLHHKQYSVSANHEKHTIDVSEVPQGIYYLQIVDEEGKKFNKKLLLH